jgi:bla regulator protein blaR1
VRAQTTPILLTALAMSVFISAAVLQLIAQSGGPARAMVPGADWQTPAGGKMSFEVASIRESPDSVRAMNFRWDDEAPFTPNGGYFYARNSLVNYIEFAYKLPLTDEEERAMLEHLPRWVRENNFVIQARAPSNATRDQMRLMMQSLLADRFKLAVHFESREETVAALTLIKPGIIGPALIPHSEGPPCDSEAAGSPTVSARTAKKPFPFMCGFLDLIDLPDHQRRLGARNLSMGKIANGLGRVEWIGHTLVDDTGLSGKYDFNIEWTPARAGAAPFTEQDYSDSGGPTFQRALKDQLGLKLVKRTATVQVLVIDRVEKPSEN